MSETAQPHAKPTILQALGILIAVNVVIVAFTALCGQLNLKDYWAAFIFLTYWTGVEQAKVEKLAPSVLGSFVGLGIAYLLSLAGHGGANATLYLAIALGLVQIAILCLVMGWLPLFVNFAAMFMLTAGSIPYVAEGANFLTVAQTLAVGIVFFAALAHGVGKLGEMMAKKGASKAVAAE
jgi:hypothetical protein